ncbi:Flagellar M-ring protein fliF [gamma proteobacterium IMCC1989]|nr:Flagellar M-ring protein fliF [gamma proteobacterium IMCC1989]
MLNGFSKQSKIILAVVSIILLIILGFTAQWALNKNYQSLFVGLEPKDSAAIVQQLDALKAEYRINKETGNVEVPSSQVHSTRLQLMGTDVTISGGVGYEIFDNSDFGMTEFAQRINYQRALEGELQRTITSLSQVKKSRVHLVLPERSLFRENKEQPSASVTLIVKKGMSLTGTQISGIQRLVSSSVSGLKEPMVIINDQQGVTLSQEIPADEIAQAIPWRLKQKKDIESYLTEKVSRVLRYAFKDGDIAVSIDVIIDFNYTKKMEEKVIPLAEGKAISREKESFIGGNKKTKNNNSNVTKETEYEMGRSVAETTESPGKIQQLSIGIILTKFLSENDKQELQRLVETTVGFNENRGDHIAIYTSLAIPETKEMGDKPALSVQPKTLDDHLPPIKKVQVNTKANHISVLGYNLNATKALYIFGISLFVAMALIFILLMQFKSKKQPKKLTPQEKEAMLMQMQHWLGEKK